MARRLFNENETWTNEGFHLRRKIRRFFHNICREYDGVSLRDITLVFHTAVSETACDAMVRRLENTDAESQLCELAEAAAQAAGQLRAGAEQAEETAKAMTASIDRAIQAMGEALAIPEETQDAQDNE